jgi:hypothetical protein
MESGGSMKHHPQCSVRLWHGRCNKRCEVIQRTIDAFNADDSKTHRSNPDSREHRRARWPILAVDCDYEISGFSGVEGRSLPADQSSGMPKGGGL